MTGSSDSRRIPQEIRQASRAPRQAPGELRSTSPAPHQASDEYRLAARPFLETPRIVFRPWAESDLELALALWGDPVVTEWIGGPFSAATVRERLEREIETQRMHGVQYWPIFRRADAGRGVPASGHGGRGGRGGRASGRASGQPEENPADAPRYDAHLGCCGLRPYRLEDGIYELGFHLRPEHWGQGYATEAARAVIDHAFDTLHARALFAGHHPGNVASRRLLEKLGFRYTHDEFYAPTGLEHPSYLLESPRPPAHP